MPKYYFHVYNAEIVARDKEGMELPNDQAAIKAEALRGARSIISHEALDGEIDLRGRISVTDDQGADVLELRYDEAVEIIAAPAAIP